MTRRSKMGSPNLAVAYLRTSTDRQDLGPEAQRAEILRWSEHNGIQIVAWHLDQITGSAPLAARPALGAALQDARDLGAGVLVVQKRDRLARDVGVARAVEAEAARLGARVVAADGAGNGDDPTSRLYRTMLDAFSEHERAVMGLRIRAALAVKKRRGERVGTVPFGFAPAPDGRLEPDFAEQAVVGFVLAQRAAGLSLRRIVRAAAAAGLVGRARRPLGLTQIAHIVRSRSGGAPPDETTGGRHE